MIIYEIALHAAKPEANFNFECRYSGYKRQLISATTDEWNVIKTPGNLFTRSIVITNKNEIRFPNVESGIENVNYISIQYEKKILFVIKASTISYVKTGEAPTIPPGAIRLVSEMKIQQ